VKFGLQLPYIVPFLNRTSLVDWCQRIEDGPFDSLMTGERIAYDNCDQIVTLAAAAALTSRPKIFAGLSVLPMHPAALVAKRIASLDLVSEGRVVLGVGVGGRLDDYAAAEQPMTDLHQRLDEEVEAMRAIWADRDGYDGNPRIGPAPVQPGGPPLYAGARGPKSLARAARWADGYFGGSMRFNDPAMSEIAARCSDAWSVAGRTTSPYLIDAVWFALGPGGYESIREAGHRYWSNAQMRHQLNWDTDMAPCYNEERLRKMIDAYEAAGWDELAFIPASADIAQADLLADILASL
jgi:alkanesulfonate monooxygenase SsuD/methylene tetrahydromethanopterin reductase-like flavin-dependent oxidoreductase (luciferase family)